MLLSRVKYLFTSRSSFYPNQNFKWENFFFHKNIHSCDRKKFLSWKKTLKKEKKLREISKDNHFWQNEKPIFIWIRDIKKFLLALKWIFVTNKKKLDWLFVSLQHEKRLESIPLKHDVVLQWNGALLFVIQWLARFFIWRLQMPICLYASMPLCLCACVPMFYSLFSWEFLV